MGGYKCSLSHAVNHYRKQCIAGVGGSIRTSPMVELGICNHNEETLVEILSSLNIIPVHESDWERRKQWVDNSFVIHYNYHVNNARYKHVGYWYMRVKHTVCSAQKEKQNYLN